MTMIEASAPGKLVLVGEYSVLDGGTAISAAVDERAKVRIRPTATDDCELHINNTGEQFIFSLSPEGAPRWRVQPGHLGRLLETALLHTLGSRDAENPVKPFAVTLCTRDFYVSGPQKTRTKTGIGSSAALAVALTAALQRYLQQEPAFDMCNDIHRSFQLGKGSGIDVMTSWHGGVIAVQKGSQGELRASPLAWLSGLHVLPVWTGVTASTPEMLDYFAGFRSRSPAAYQQLLEQMRTVSAGALVCWQEGKVEDFLDQAKNFATLLKELDKAAQIGIWSDAHLQLEAVAAEYGAAYKPSGAGRGDFGLIFTADNDQLYRLKQRLGKQRPDYPEICWTNRGLELTSTAGSS